MTYHFRHSICNELYESRPFAQVCRDVRAAGYEGMEIAPFTLAVEPKDISLAARREYRDQIISEGLSFVGLHWLMVSPKGLHVSSPDSRLRARSWQHIVELIDLCGDLGAPGSVSGLMIFGSPKQRCACGGLAPEEARRHFVAGLADVAPRAASRGITILVEALPSSQCDVITSLAEASRVVQEINHPAIRTMFDTHNAAEENEPHAVLVERYFDLIRHVHVNEMDGRYPGSGGYDFKSLLSALARLNYEGFVSLEVFDFAAGPDRIAEESLHFLKKEAAQIET